PRHVDELTAAGTPVVLLDRICATERGAAVLVDNAAGAVAATRHLLEHGRRRLGCVTGPAEASTAAERLAGYAEALEYAGVELDPDLVVHGAFSRRSGYDAAIELLGRTDGPDGIVAACDQQAIGVLQACHRLGVVVPD